MSKFVLIQYMIAITITKFMMIVVISMNILCSFKKEASLIDLTTVDQDQGQLHSGVGRQVPAVMLTIISILNMFWRVTDG